MRRMREGKTPFQVAASKGHDEMTKLLLEHGAVPQPVVVLYTLTFQLPEPKNLLS